MDKRHERKSAVVPEAKQAEETRSMVDWVERAVWTDRMLQALQDGVKGGVWFSLIDKVFAHKNLEAAFRKVRSNKGSAGVDHKTIAQFESQLEAELAYVAKTLRDGTYRPMAVKRVYIPKPGKPEEKRPLGIPSVRDRVVQTAVRNVIEPIFEKDFEEWTKEAGLALHPDKTRIVDMSQPNAGFVFLGYQFMHTKKGLKKWASDKAMKRVRYRIRELTPRVNGRSLEVLVRRLNQSLKGFYEYFKHGRPFVFTKIDQWVRVRLRAELAALRR